jgi:hypothetical protein
MVQQADAVIASSHAVAIDLEGRICVDPQRVFVAYPGISDRYTPPPETALDVSKLLGAFGIKDGFLLSVNPSAHRSPLLPAYATLPAAVRDRHQLVVVSSEADRNLGLFLKDEVTSLGIESHVVNVSTVDDATEVALYQTCRAFVFPSLDGSCPLPVIKAMRCGAPVIVSDTGSLSEIVRDPESRFDPSDEASLAAAMEEILTNDPFLESRRESSTREAARYSWDAWEVAVLEAYDRAARRRP